MPRRTLVDECECWFYRCVKCARLSTGLWCNKCECSDGGMV